MEKAEKSKDTNANTGGKKTNKRHVHRSTYTYTNRRKGKAYEKKEMGAKTNKERKINLR